MKYCMKCGVKVDEEKHSFCPLCESIILTDDELAILTRDGLKEKQKSVIETIHEEGRKLIINKLGLSALILFLVFLIAIITLFVIDYAQDQKLTWSVLPILSMFVFDTVLNLTLLNEERTFIYTASLSLFILMGYFFSVNYILSQKISWSYYIIITIGLILLYLHIIHLKVNLIMKLFLSAISSGLYVLLLFVGPYGNPVINFFVLGLNTLIFVVGAVTYIFIKTYIYNKYLIVATVSIAFSVLIKGLEWLLNRFMIEGGTLNFSFYVLVILIPITILMFILNNKQKVIDYVKKKYHI